MTNAMDLELQGRTARAHIDKWEQYGKKANQHATSAAIILIEAKGTLGHTKYGRWLRKHDIVPQTASRLVLEHHQPEKAVERKAKDRAAKARDREVVRGAKRAESAKKTPPNPLKNQETTPPTLDAWAVGKRAELLSHIQTADDAEVDRVHSLVFGGGHP